MDGYIVHGGLDLARGEFLRLQDGKGIVLYVWEGELWITQERDRKDHYVGRGTWFRLDRDGAALVHAMRRASLTATAPVASRYARRISLGSVVIYDRAQEPGAWARISAPFSRPTTAAL
jgi:hypothetical protein